MAALLTATIGVSVHQIYCYCAGMRSISFFAVSDGCSAQKAAVADVPNCCAKKKAVRSCCEKDSKDSKKEPSGCTKKTTRFFQLKTEFTLSEKDAGKVFQTLPDVVVPPAFVGLPLHEITTESAGFQTFPNPPPPLSGRMICVRHCVALC